MVYVTLLDIALPEVFAAKLVAVLSIIVPFKILGSVMSPAELTAKFNRFAVVQSKIPKDTVGSVDSIKNGLLAFIFVLIIFYLM
mgnify:FL=1